MSATHTVHGTHANRGPRFSASDRPLPLTEARMTSRARVQLAASIIAVYGLAALAIVAPMATLALLVGAVVVVALIAGMSRLADRTAKSWGPPAHEECHSASPRMTREGT